MSKFTPHDAAKMLGLAPDENGKINKETLKKAWKEKLKQYHPDINPAGEELSKAINAAYETLKEYDGILYGNDPGYLDAFASVLGALHGLPGLEILRSGAWLWITGDTKTHKDRLKAAGCKWSPGKQAWYYRPEEAGRRHGGRGKMSMAEITAKYGAEKVTAAGTKKVAA